MLRPTPGDPRGAEEVYCLEMYRIRDGVSVLEMHRPA